MKTCDKSRRLWSQYCASRERFTLQGKPQQTELAAKVLQRFYDQAGNALDIEDIQLDWLKPRLIPWN